MRVARRRLGGLRSQRLAWILGIRGLTGEDAASKISEAACKSQRRDFEGGAADKTLQQKGSKSQGRDFGGFYSCTFPVGILKTPYM